MTSICPRCGSRNRIAYVPSLRHRVRCKGYRIHGGVGRYGFDRPVPCGHFYAVGDELPVKRRRYFMARVAEFGWRVA